MRKLILFTSLLLLFVNFQLLAQQDWNWKSPNPQGNQINHIFTGNNMFFGIGECGTIISTVNAGVTWSVLNKVTGGPDNITAFQKYDENTYYIGTSYNRMQRTTNGGLNWIGSALIYESSPTGIRGLAYTSSNTGYAITFKNIYKTTNGGATWNLLKTVPDELTSIYFINNNTGFVTTVGGMEGGVATIYKTTDGGVNWTPVIFNGWAETFKILKFVNESTGFIQHGGVRNNNRLYKTVNAGMNWAVIGTNQVFGRIHIFDENNFIGTDYYNLKITTDGGSTWSIKSQPFMEPLDINFQSPQKGYILDHNNRISVTDNAGDNWTQITDANGNGSASDQLRELEFINENTGFVIGRNSKFRKTINGGETWVNYETDLPSVSGFDFLDANTGFVSGTSSDWKAYISKTTNGGENFTKYLVSDDYLGTKLKFVNANTGFAAGYYKFFSTTNGGVNWQTVTLQDSIDIYSMEFIDGNTGILCGKLYQSFVNKVYRTTNAGLNWTPVYATPNSLYNSLGKIKMVNNLKGYICGYGIWTTTNGGESWYQMNISGIPQFTYLSSIEFINEQTGFVVGTGVIYRTTNGGSQWATGSMPTQGRIESIKFFNASTGIMAGDKGAILKTTNGGGIFLVGVASLNNSIASDYKLHQNYPNPFNPVTNIQFDIPKSDFVTVRVYDILGKEVENLVSEFKPAGSYNISFDASNLGSGVYFYRLETNNFAETKRMVLVK
jgi:photosystem II stability/assembly factor-like uncharacterized protein